MNKNLNSSCPSCKNVDIIPAAFIQQHSGKSIVVKCKSCRHSYRQQLPDIGKRTTKIDIDALSIYRSESLYALVADYNNKLIAIPLEVGENIIGRNLLSSLSESVDPTLSREHFKITVQKLSSDQYEYIVRDNGSSNKLRLNMEDEPIDPDMAFYFKMEDALIAGETKFQLQNEFVSE